MDISPEYNSIRKKLINKHLFEYNKKVLVYMDIVPNVIIVYLITDSIIVFREYIKT